MFSSALQNFVRVASATTVIFTEAILVPRRHGAPHVATNENRGRRVSIESGAVRYSTRRFVAPSRGSTCPTAASSSVFMPTFSSLPSCSAAVARTVRVAPAANTRLVLSGWQAPPFAATSSAVACAAPSSSSSAGSSSNRMPFAASTSSESHAPLKTQNQSEHLKRQKSRYEGRNVLDLRVSDTGMQICAFSGS